jgi:N,N'-diacetyllegionaminate synthase
MSHGIEGTDLLTNDDGSFLIEGRPVGVGHPCLIIGEVGQNHDGSLGLAHSFIDAVADAGADAVKFQTHIADAESTLEEPFRVNFSRQDSSRWAYWKRIEFAREEWFGLAEHARQRGLIFMSSPFSEEAVDLLLECEIGVWKVASGETQNIQLLDRILETGLPVIVSTGMSTVEEIRDTVAYVREAGCAIGILQCTSRYPTPPEEVGVDLIPTYRQLFNCPVGLSDHSGKIFSGLAAVTLGANLLEVHVTLSREMFGPDIPASLTTGELRQLVEGVRFTEQMLRRPTDKNELARGLHAQKQIFSKSVVARRSLTAGHVLTKDDLALKKPGIGISPRNMSEVIGRRLRRDLNPDEFLSHEDLE